MKGVPPKSKWGRILLICNVFGWLYAVYLMNHDSMMHAKIFVFVYQAIYCIVYFSLAKHYNNDRDQEEKNKKDEED